LKHLKREFLDGSAGRGFETVIAENGWWFLLNISAHVRLRENVQA